MALSLHRRPVSSAFDLLGSDENGMTAALGYAMSRSHTLLAGIIRELGGPSVGGPTHIALQTHRGWLGITDIEVGVGDEFLAIIEAKQGAQLPSSEQLAKYADVLAERPAKSKSLATLSDLTPQFVESIGPASAAGYPIKHLSWRNVLRMARSAREKEDHASKRVLDELIAYLTPLIGMDSLYSNMAYVVSLANGYPDGWAVSWIDVIEKHSRYFYRAGKGWPPSPPNYVAFRYHGQLQSIHHITDFDLFTDPGSVIRGAPRQKWEPHFILTLGPAIRPSKRTPTGPRIRMSNRVWCFVDTLLTADSVSDALTQTQARIQKWESSRAV